MESLTEYDKKILHDVDLYGWHVIKVAADELGPSFGYSIGMYQNFNHPEIIIIGLELKAIHFFINKMGDFIRTGIQFQAGHFYENLLENVDCYFTAVNPDYYKNYVSYATWFYKESAFPVLQCIYPTVTGVYPWQSHWPELLKDQQPVLGSYPRQ